MYYDRMSVWALMIVLVREFAVAGIRLVAAGEGKVVAASMWGKLKNRYANGCDYRCNAFASDSKYILGCTP